MTRQICTKDNPWTGTRNQVAHPDARIVSDPNDTAFSTGNKTGYHCPNCGLNFKVTEADY